jgi:hypothetical protein
MALFDVLFEFSDADVQTIIATGTGTLSTTNVIDMQATDLEMGAGEPVWLNIRTATQFAGAGNITFALVNDTNATIDSGSVKVLTTETMAIATDARLAPGGWILRTPLPNDFDSDQYVGVVCVSSGASSAGAVDAWLDHGSISTYKTQVSTSNI